MNQKVQLKDDDTPSTQKGRAETRQPQTDRKPGVASLPLPPYDPSVPMGQFTCEGNGCADPGPSGTD